MSCVGQLSPRATMSTECGCLVLESPYCCSDYSELVYIEAALFLDEETGALFFKDVQSTAFGEWRLQVSLCGYGGLC